MRPATLTVRLSSPVRTLITSETRTERDGLTASPLIFTWPARQAAVARERVLYRRTAQSHLSRRTSPIGSIQKLPPGAPLLQPSVSGIANAPSRLMPSRDSKSSEKERTSEIIF